ncbi:DUF3788 family protein [Candidatus Enterococcus ferrettii]|uniref:DUF3788 family protein n=1 Tax=Candidatus Enterococcus ferrettii TaxID=2815324 RepID=A0ABV0ESJ5_9ENTE|nr:DUF3788 family protein [Enterococcus sp. 665A]MBO1342382.1 DUF3788 family protein [Enterococcus sp. 665A]
MAVSIFDDKATTPDDTMLLSVLKEAQLLWNEAIHFVEQFGGITQGEWKFYTKAAGWTYVVKSNKRTMFYLIPKDAHLQATFVFGEKAVAAAEEANLPIDVLKNLRSAKAYVEGRSIAILVKDTEDLAVFKRLVTIKVEN